MNERLDKICFLPPVIDTPWVGAPEDDLSTTIARADGEQIAIGLPLFWYASSKFCCLFTIFFFPFLP